MAAKKTNQHSKKPTKYKSGLEKRFAELCFKNGVKAEYEKTRFKFVKVGHYTPDWKINDKLYVETKGYFSPSNRGNLLSFREQHPDVEIFLVFGQPENRLTKKSKTTYAAWCEQHGFRWASISKFPLHLFKKEKEESK